MLFPDSAICGHVLGVVLLQYPCLKTDGYQGDGFTYPFL